jgi:hypothetical protein
MLSPDSSPASSSSCRPPSFNFKGLLLLSGDNPLSRLLLLRRLAWRRICLPDSSRETSFILSRPSTGGAASARLPCIQAGSSKAFPSAVRSSRKSASLSSLSLSAGTREACLRAGVGEVLEECCFVEGNTRQPGGCTSGGRMTKLGRGRLRMSNRPNIQLPPLYEKNLCVMIFVCYAWYVRKHRIAAIAYRPLATASFHLIHCHRDVQRQLRKPRPPHEQS